MMEPSLTAAMAAVRRTITVNPCRLFSEAELARIAREAIQGAFPVSATVRVRTPFGSITLGTVIISDPVVRVSCPSGIVTITFRVRFRTRLGTVSGTIRVTARLTAIFVVLLRPLRLISAQICVINPRIVDVDIRNVPGDVERVARSLLNDLLPRRRFCVDITGRLRSNPAALMQLVPGES